MLSAKGLDVAEQHQAQWGPGREEATSAAPGADAVATER
jgi:hypothetical protein